MKALILNSGLGTRMGDRTKNKPKCMTEIGKEETIISRQLKILNNVGIKEVVITTGPFEKVLKNYISKLNTDINITFVNNPDYKKTNYIYSIYLAREVLKEDILLLHGDLVFTEEVVLKLLEQKKSCVIVDSSIPLPDKDFKAVIFENKVKAIGIEFFENVLACQPMYYLLKEDWAKWLKEICAFCNNSNTGCYAEKALNKIADSISLYPLDLEGKLCREIDCEEDLINVIESLQT